MISGRVAKLRPGAGPVDAVGVGDGRALAVDDHDPTAGVAAVVGRELLELVARRGVRRGGVERLLRADRERERVVLEVAREAALDRVRVRHAERDLEDQQHERGDREVTDEQSPLHRARRRSGSASGTRHRARSRSNAGHRASCAATRRARRASSSARTNAGPRLLRAPVDGCSTAPGSSARNASRSNSLGVSATSLSSTTTRRVRRSITRPRQSRWRPQATAARDAGAATARMRATSSRKPNGFTM